MLVDKLGRNYTWNCWGRVSWNMVQQASEKGKKGEISQGNVSVKNQRIVYNSQ
jgi:hypothetical protein